MQVDTKLVNLAELGILVQMPLTHVAIVPKGQNLRLRREV
jgi:hypothetical protein